MKRPKLILFDASTYFYHLKDHEELMLTFTLFKSIKFRVKLYYKPNFPKHTIEIVSNNEHEGIIFFILKYIKHIFLLNNEQDLIKLATS